MTVSSAPRLASASCLASAIARALALAASAADAQLPAAISVGSIGSARPRSSAGTVTAVASSNRPADTQGDVLEAALAARAGLRHRIVVAMMVDQPLRDALTAFDQRGQGEDLAQRALVSIRDPIHPARARSRGCGRAYPASSRRACRRACSTARAARSRRSHRSTRSATRRRGGSRSCSRRARSPARRWR